MAKPLTGVLTTLLKWAAVTAIALLMPRSTQRQSIGAHVTSERPDHKATLTDEPLIHQTLNDSLCACTEVPDGQPSDVEQTSFDQANSDQPKSQSSA